MIKINLLTIGTLKEKYLKDALNEYSKRLSKYASVSIYEGKESKLINDDYLSTINEEGEDLLKRIKNDEFVILLDLHGSEISSEEFSKKIDSLINKGYGKLCFVIGGTYGVSQKLVERSNFSLCLSKMTFTHQFTRVILLEQIYRAFKIINNEPYHH